MSFFANLSLTKKITGIIMLTTLVVLILSSSMYVIYEVHSSRASLVKELKTMAGLLGTNSIPALEFNDPSSARDTLLALNNYPNIVYACLYDEDGNEFASFSTLQISGKRCLNITEYVFGAQFSQGKINLYIPILFHKQQVGSLFIQSETKEIRSRIYRYLFISIIVLLGSSIVAFFLSSRLQRVISRPILQLTEAASKVSEEKNYSLRVKADSRDEIGTLIERFNEMLENIQQRDTALQNAQEELEDKVRERTEELQQAHSEAVRAKEEADSLNLELERIASLDGLTRVANRRSFDEYLNREWRRLAREQKPMALILCDIDYFKPYNDTYGHLAGDNCLQRVAQALTEATNRPADLVARYGGEEFVVVLPDTDMDGALSVAHELALAIKQLDIPHGSSSTSDHLTLSIGVSTVIPDISFPSEELISKADDALYQAKHDGRNRIVFKSFDGK